MRHLLFLLLPACVHQVTILSDPAGAQVQLGRTAAGVTPTVVEVSPWPWESRVIKVRAPGRRTVEFKVPRWRRSSTHEVVLIRRHGPAGTWTPEDAEL